jgi:Na+/proline symporter
MIVSIAIVLSYLGWVSAQVTALGLVFNVLSDGSITQFQGVIIGTGIVLIYTLFGGMLSVAYTDTMQMTIIVLGFLWIAYLVSEQTGGVAPVIAQAAADGKFAFFPDYSIVTMITFLAGLLTMGLGSIPQQDVFQRANASKTASIAVWGSVLGGLAYLLFASVPMFITYAATMIDPAGSQKILAEDAQLLLPSFVLTHLPLYAQVIFYGALLSVIMSTASGTLLAPSVTLSENVIREFMPNREMSDHQLLTMTRLVVAGFGVLVGLYALWSLESETTIHEMVANAYKVTLACAFVPLAAGLYWKRANNVGAGFSIALGLIVWIAFEFIAPEGVLPPQFAGFFASLAGMIVGSLASAPPSREQIA